MRNEKQEMETKQYYFSARLATSFEEAEKLTIEALKTEGFGVITEIDMQQKLKEKLNVDFKRYKILGACNPPLAYEALQAEEKIGTMLPCNVLIIEQEPGFTEVAAVNPVASMQAVQNSGLMGAAGVVTEKLQRVIGSLSEK
ncbi:MAG TPA: DUF302 domain-containing protein [Prolixibacteraceae bacterium]|nr:DUF302 domain-containing protein [Prolixibacteraceae bacterium]